MRHHGGTITRKRPELVRCAESPSVKQVFTIVPVPEVINIPHCVNGEVVNHTARSDERVGLRVDVRVTFPWLTGTKLYKTYVHNILVIFMMLSNESCLANRRSARDFA